MAMNPYAAPSADLDAGVGAEAQTLAGAGARFAAHLIDNMIVFGVPAMILALGGIGKGANEGPNHIAEAVAGLAFLIIGIYQLYGLSTRGQSLAKRWLGVRIVKQDGGPVSFGSAVMVRLLVG